ncbi:MAG: tRNA (adenine(22)-N(1))-methyltransferase TrmK [Clostridia bacterium]|nr:tRNA (adenine(22)-N(1))-methyltransferase TrmK [Clostridia bacterium]
MLDARLSLALSLYEPCSLAADIGTDHAHLPIALLRSGRCQRMILSDISPDALSNARGNIARAGLTSRVDFRLGDGLAPLGERCGMISILGMGGRTIQEMLLRHPEALQEAPLLLSAHTDLPLVRQAVMDIGYHLVSETPCLDAGRYYLMLKALPGPEALTPQELRLGKQLFFSDAPALQPYLAHRLSVLSHKLQGLQRAASPDKAQIAELESDIEYLKGAMIP